MSPLTFVVLSRYTLIGRIHDTIPNGLLCINSSYVNEEKFRLAYLLVDGRLERVGRMKRVSFKAHYTMEAMRNYMIDLVPSEITILAQTFYSNKLE